MDVEKEVRAANQRIQRGIEYNALIALAKIEGLSPQHYARKVDAERAAEATRASVAAAEAFGASLRAINDALIEAAEAVARGWNAGGR